MELSIVTTLFRSAGHLPEFYTRMTAAARAFAQDSYEMILVNDGSPDDSLQVACDFQSRDPHLVIVDLSRNFGHHKAIMTGLSFSRGRLVWLIDCDLEEEPERLAGFAAELQRTGADVVYGQQMQRKGGWFERVSGAVFYRVFNLLTHEPVPRSVLTMRLMTRRFVDGAIQFRDRELFLLGILTLTGFRQVPISVLKGSRGESSYSLRRRIAMVVNAITSFSNVPLVFIFYLGVAIFLLAMLSAAVLVLRWAMFGELLVGWPSMIISIWLLGGVTIMCLGIIGVYLAKIFMEVKIRPNTVVRAIYRSEGAPSTPGDLPPSGII